MVAPEASGAFCFYNKDLKIQRLLLNEQRFKDLKDYGRENLQNLKIFVRYLSSDKDLKIKKIVGIKIFKILKSLFFSVIQSLFSKPFPMS